MHWWIWTSDSKLTTCSSNLLSGGERLFRDPRLLLKTHVHFPSRWMFSFFYSVLQWRYSVLLIRIMGVFLVLLIKAVTRDPHLFDKPMAVIVRDSQHSCSWASDSLFGMEDHLRGFLRWGFLLFENWSYSEHCPVDLLSSNVRLWINNCQSSC